MAELTRAQQMMVEDGLPIEFIRTAERQQEIDAMAKAGPKEQQVAGLRIKRATEWEADSPPPQQEKTDMSKTPKKAAKKTAKKAPARKAPKAAKKTAAKAPASPKPAKVEKPAPAASSPAASPEARKDGLRPGSKQAQMMDLVYRPEGATHEALCAALSWKSCLVTLNRTVERVGAELRKEQNADKKTVYFATLPEAA